MPKIWLKSMQKWLLYSILHARCNIFVGLCAAHSTMQISQSIFVRACAVIIYDNDFINVFQVYKC